MATDEAKQTRRKRWDKFIENVALYATLPIMVLLFLVDTIVEEFNKRYRYRLWRKYWTLHAKLSGSKRRVSSLDKALQNAVSTNNAHNVEIFLKRGADANGCFFARQSLLIKAAGGEGTEVTRLLLRAGANPDASDPVWKATPLIYAAIKGRCASAALLLEHGASLSSSCYKGHNALHYATVYGHPEMMQLLLKEAIKRGEKLLNAQAVMHFATEKNLCEVVALLEQLGVSQPPALLRPAYPPLTKTELSRLAFPNRRHHSRPVYRNSVLKKRTRKTNQCKIRGQKKSGIE